MELAALRMLLFYAGLQLVCCVLLCAMSAQRRRFEGASYVLLWLGAGAFMLLAYLHVNAYLGLSDPSPGDFYEFAGMTSHLLGYGTAFWGVAVLLLRLNKAPGRGPSGLLPALAAASFLWGIVALTTMPLYHGMREGYEGELAGSR